MKIIEAKHLRKAFHEKVILDDVSFSIDKGTFTALLGKNGSGKSTTLNILMGQLKLDEGDCFLFGESVKDDPYHLKNKIGHVTEKIRFDYPASVESFIRDYSKLFEKFNLKLFFQMAKDVDINLSNQFGSYSRGQKMQIVLMAALSHSPEVLLIDEITSVLDAYSRNYFIERLHNFRDKGGTVVITTNIVSEVQHSCTDVIFLSDNKIKFQTPLKDIPANFTKVRWAHKDKLPAGQYIISGINSDGSLSYIIPNELLTQAVAEGMTEDKRTVTLEDLYIYHSQEKAA